MTDRNGRLTIDGDQAVLQEVISDLTAAPLDRERPMWDVYLLEGFGGGCALMVRMHHAIADGIVTRGPYPFYCETFALEVDHGEFLARYGEIQKTTTVKEGDRVHAGQQIAKVGHLIGIQVPSDMLHLELYDKSASGPLTITDANRSKKRSDGVPFMRRMDLIDPTSQLTQWQVRLPKA